MLLWTDGEIVFLFCGKFPCSSFVARVARVAHFKFVACMFLLRVNSSLDIRSCSKTIHLSPLSAPRIKSFCRFIHQYDGVTALIQTEYFYWYLVWLVVVSNAANATTKLLIDKVALEDIYIG
mgnify:CR=1 FL=1